MSDDSTYGRTPTCPWCNHVMRGHCPSDFPQEQLTEVECGGCEKTYYVEMHMLINYTGHKTQ